jgi:hypothetical protein
MHTLLKLSLDVFLCMVKRAAQYLAIITSGFACPLDALNL